MVISMPRTLWVLRHGDAEPHGVREDFQRRLTPRGERQARLAGIALARMAVAPEFVFASPRVRALETARIACEALAVSPMVHTPLQGGFTADDAAELLATVDGDGTLLLVGHEPDLSGLVQSYSSARVEMKKGGLAALRVGRGGNLSVLLGPREIERLVQER
jgi:phosphohistidine phosphatase